MKRWKTASALLLALLLCVTALPVSAAAEVTLTAGSVTAKAGDTIAVPITISRTEQVAGVGLHVSYDQTVLECVDAVLSDTVASMDMASANPEPVNHPGEVWLTAISIQKKLLEGEIMTITFKVKSTAPTGVTPIKILSEGLSISQSTDKQLAVEVVDGGVEVIDELAQIPPVTAATTTAATAASSTAAQTAATTAAQGMTAAQTTASGDVGSTQVTDVPATTTATLPQGMAPVVDSEGETITRADGETVVTPEETAVDLSGNVVTGTNGEPSKMQSIAVMIDELTATPGETVTVNVSLSAVSDLTALGIGIKYNTDALRFDGGDCVGFVKDGMSMAAVVENEAGVVDISAMGATPVSGSGVIAQLRFTVKDNAKSGEYRLSAASDPLLQADMIELPVKLFAGEIRVEGGAEGGANGLYIALALVLAAALVVLIVMLILRRKKAAPSKETRSHVVDVSGDDEE